MKRYFTESGLMQQEIKVIWNGVRVKNAILMSVDSKYVLQYYDTIILEVEGGEVRHIRPNISVSSTRAINQDFEYLGLDCTAKDFKNRRDIGADLGTER
jgi:hypothetical protein